MQPPTAPISGQQVFVTFSAEINLSTTEALLNILSVCASQGATGVYLMLSTSGGNVTCGLTLYNAMRGMPYEITTHNIGDVASIGNAVYLAGTKRLVAPQSTFMFHGVSYTTIGETSYEKDLEERLASILRDQARIGEVITKHTNLTIEDVEAMFRDATTKTALEAVQLGIADAVQEVSITPGCPVFSLVFPR